MLAYLRTYFHFATQLEAFGMDCLKVWLNSQWLLRIAKICDEGDSITSHLSDVWIDIDLHF